MIFAAMWHACLIFWEPPSFREAWNTQQAPMHPSVGNVQAQVEASQHCFNASDFVETSGHYGGAVPTAAGAAAPDLGCR